MVDTRPHEHLDGACPDPSDRARHFVARTLQHHGVAALTWRDGEVDWANEVALDLVSGEDAASYVDLLRRLSRSFHPPPELDRLQPDEERVVEIELASTRALLRLTALAARGSGAHESSVLVTFRAPPEEAADPTHLVRLQTMLDAASDIITVIDRRGRVLLANPAAGRLTGVTGAEANGSHMLGFVHPEDELAVADAFLRGVLEGEQIDPFVVRIRMADGEWHHTEVRLAGKVEIDGTEGHVVSIRDISDRIRRDAEAEAYRRRLESLVENIDDVIVILDPDLSVRWTSPGIERFIDAPAYTNVGEHAFNDMHPEDQEGVLSAIQAAMAEPDGRSRARFRLRHERVGWRWLEAGVVNRLDDPAVEGLIATIREVAELDDSDEMRRLRKDERDEMERLREADRLKDRFLATVSHELRTPLTSVRGFSALLKSQWSELADDQRAQLIDRIAANAIAMETMIEQLLDFSRLQAGRVEVDLQPLELDDVVAEVIDSLVDHLHDHEVVVATHGIRATGDRHAFGHVLRNLLTNAARYSSAGTRIDVSAERGGDEVHIRVRDRGIGIAPGDQTRVFQSFFQSAPGATDRRGTGVGLNVARRFAQVQHGRLELESELGVGTTVTFTLPAA